MVPRGKCYYYKYDNASFAAEKPYDILDIAYDQEFKTNSGRHEQHKSVHRKIINLASELDNEIG